MRTAEGGDLPDIRLFFEQASAESEAENVAFTVHASKLGAYARHAYEISGDHRGTELREYMSDEDANVCETFLEVAYDRGNPNSTPWSMRTHIIPGHTAWRPPYRTMSAMTITQNLVYPIRARGIGWLIGNLGVHQTPPVLLCSDGYLRNLRTPEHLKKSLGVGWGRLPDREIMEPAIMHFNTPINRRPPLPLEEFLAKYLIVPHR